MLTPRGKSPQPDDAEEDRTEDSELNAQTTDPFQSLFCLIPEAMKPIVAVPGCRFC